MELCYCTRSYVQWYCLTSIAERVSLHVWSVWAENQRFAIDQSRAWEWLASVGSWKAVWNSRNGPLVNRMGYVSLELAKSQLIRNCIWRARPESIQTALIEKELNWTFTCSKRQLQTYTGPERYLYNLDMNVLVPASASLEITAGSLIKGEKLSERSHSKALLISISPSSVTSLNSCFLLHWAIQYDQREVTPSRLPI